MRRGLLIILPLICVGVIAAFVAIADHQGDAAFVFAQQHPSGIQSRQLELIIAKAREPVASGHGSSAMSANCTPGHAQRGNPWACSVRYASGHVIRYRVEVQRNGALVGSDPTGQFNVNGCCLAGANNGLQQ